MIKFIPLGGAGEIGASCFYLNIAGTGMILDCGMHPQKKGLNALPDFDIIQNENIDFVVISHAHQDHLDALPFLVKKFPYVQIFTTPQTRAVAEKTLHNTISILREQIPDDEYHLYSHEEIDLLIQSIQYKSYEEKFSLRGYKHESKSEINISFHDAGHIIGSAGIFIEHNGKKIFYTGDINLQKQSLLAGAYLPKQKIDVLITESTYGSTDSSKILKWQKEAERLAKSLNKILNNNGSVLIPVFALGKMQEMLSLIYNLMMNKKIPLVDIYTGGIANKISRIYDYNRFVINVNDSAFELSQVPQKNYFEVENHNDFFNSPCIVLASSGMVIEKTASYKFAQQWLKQSKSAIFTVGYMDSQTPGYQIANARKGDKIKLSEFAEEEEVKCEVQNFRFSAHSKREDLLQIVELLNPLTVILVHGDVPAIDWMGANILKQNPNVKLFAAEKGREINI
jgi:Cft2 family RNA processing exonuclease